MKQMKGLPKLETRTVALLTGLTNGPGIAAHHIFFIVAALIALAAPIESAARWIHKRVTSSDPGAPALVKAPQKHTPPRAGSLLPKIDSGCRYRGRHRAPGYLR